MTVDGAEVDTLEFDPANLPPNSRVTVSGGVVFLNEESTNGPTLEAYFKSWRKKQTTVFMTVEVSRADAEKVQAAITAAGGKWVA